jgi:hypothetical protein
MRTAFNACERKRIENDGVAGISTIAAATATIAPLGDAEDRVRGDPGRVVVGEPGEHARTDDGDQGSDGAGAQQPAPSEPQAQVEMTSRWSRP